MKFLFLFALLAAVFAAPDLTWKFDAVTSLPHLYKDDLSVAALTQATVDTIFTAGTKPGVALGLSTYDSVSRIHYSVLVDGSTQALVKATLAETSYTPTFELINFSTIGRTGALSVKLSSVQLSSMIASQDGRLFGVGALDGKFVAVEIDSATFTVLHEYTGYDYISLGVLAWDEVSKNLYTVMTDSVSTSHLVSINVETPVQDSHSFAANDVVTNLYCYHKLDASAVASSELYVSYLDKAAAKHTVAKIAFPLTSDITFTGKQQLTHDSLVLFVGTLNSEAAAIHLFTENTGIFENVYNLVTPAAITPVDVNTAMSSVFNFFMSIAEKQICTPVAVANTANVEATPVFGPAGTYIPGSQVEFTASPGYHLCEGVTPLTEFTENCQYDRTFLENNPTRTVEENPVITTDATPFSYVITPLSFGDVVSVTDFDTHLDGATSKINVTATTQAGYVLSYAWTVKDVDGTNLSVLNANTDTATCDDAKYKDANNVWSVVITSTSPCGNTKSKTVTFVVSGCTTASKCKTCDTGNLDVCTSCVTGRYIKGDGTCGLCSDDFPNCAECSLADSCTKCADTFVQMTEGATTSLTCAAPSACVATGGKWLENPTDLFCSDFTCAASCATNKCANDAIPTSSYYTGDEFDSDVTVADKCHECAANYVTEDFGGAVKCVDTCQVGNWKNTVGGICQTCMTGCDKCTADGLNTECDICAVGETNRFARTDAGVCTAIVKDSADAYIYSDSTDVNDFCNNGIATKGSFIEMKGADTEYTCKTCVEDQCLLCSGTGCSECYGESTLKTEAAKATIPSTYDQETLSSYYILEINTCVQKCLPFIKMFPSEQSIHLKFNGAAEGKDLTELTDGDEYHVLMDDTKTVSVTCADGMISSLPITEIVYTCEGYKWTATSTSSMICEEEVISTTTEEEESSGSSIDNIDEVIIQSTAADESFFSSSTGTAIGLSALLAVGAAAVFIFVAKGSKDDKAKADDTPMDFVESSAATFTVDSGSNLTSDGTTGGGATLDSSFLGSVDLSSANETMGTGMDDGMTTGSSGSSMDGSGSSVGNTTGNTTGTLDGTVV